MEIKLDVQSVSKEFMASVEGWEIRVGTAAAMLKLGPYPDAKTKQIMALFGTSGKPKTDAAGAIIDRAPFKLKKGKTVTLKI